MRSKPYVSTNDKLLYLNISELWPSNIYSEYKLYSNPTLYFNPVLSLDKTLESTCLMKKPLAMTSPRPVQFRASNPPSTPLLPFPISSSLLSRTQNTGNFAAHVVCLKVHPICYTLYVYVASCMPDMTWHIENIYAAHTGCLLEPGIYFPIGYRQPVFASNMLYIRNILEKQWKNIRKSFDNHRRSMGNSKGNLTPGTNPRSPL